jgi:hypothetical protein
MSKNSIDLTEGIRLEISGSFIPWKTTFQDLTSIGRPELRVQADRDLVIWRNERILNGLRVDLCVVYEKGMYGENRKLSSVCAYLGESSFQEAKQLLEEQLRSRPKFKKLNEIEYTYSWSVKNCQVRLSHLDRFGSFWKLDIGLKPGLAGALSIRRAFRKIFRKQKEQGMHFYLPAPAENYRETLDPTLIPA